MDGSDAKRLEKIDELYRLRLDRHVSLPQLIVVGDQSSGKSSVLEALTNGLPFPRDSGLCTRFPTQIVFKRSPSTKIEVSIIPAEGEASASRFKKRELPDLDADQLVKVISEACICMGLPEPGKPAQGLKSFSSDMLKIELSGPSHEHFSVIDLPGLFRKSTPDQTTNEDIGLVRQMITSYMNNPRSIVLAVVPANVDIATQEIVHMAEQADPHRRRTLGVLTKPDLVDAGAEDKVLQLLQPSSANLGYAVVCNRSQNLLSTGTAERNAKETAFFSIEPWNQVPGDRAGILALKSLFKKLLNGLTRKSFDDVIREIENKLEAHLREKEKIGPARNDSTSQRIYLLELVTEFQMLVIDAMQSSYSRGTCFASKEMKLTSLAITTSEAFSESMKRGYKRPFRTDPESDDEKACDDDDEEEDADYDDDDDDDEEGSDGSQRDGKEADGDASFEFPELRFLTVLQPSNPQYSEESITAWIKRVHQGYRSLGIGGLNPSLYQALFKEQTGPWIPIAQSYLAETIINIHRFLDRLLKHVCKDDHTSEVIWSRITPQLKECYSRASEHLNFLLEVERDGNLGTLNHYFASNIAKANEERTINRLKDKQVSHDNDKLSDSQPLLRLSDVTSFYQSNAEFQVEQIHDTLKSYSKVACKRFVDNVYMQVVDHLLIASNKSPLKVLCSAWVGSLSDNDLAEIAGETESVRYRRKVLQEEIGSFQAGLKILRA